VLGNSAVVIGGGAIGMASAYFLQRSGWQVTIIDAGEMGKGCSYANAGLIVPSHSHPVPGPGVIGQALRWMGRRTSPFHVRPRFDPAFWKWCWEFRRYCNAAAGKAGYHALVKLSRASLDLYEELAELHGLKFFYQRKGLLHVYISANAFSMAGKEQDALSASGFLSRVLSREETLAYEPSLGSNLRGGLFIEGEAHGSCYGYVSSLAAALEKGGGRLESNRCVSGISVHRGRVSGVVTSTGDEVKADLAVLAAGSWSPQLARTVGLAIPLQPAKGYSCTIDSYPGSPRVPILMPERRVIITPLDDRLRFGGTLEMAGFDPAIDRRRYRAVIDGALAVLRDPPPMIHEESWSGFRPVTPDGLPIIDRVAGVDGLLIATGHAMLGFTQSPITGKLVAELANQESPSVPLGPFRLGRFGRTLRLN